jgi:peptidylprolyl isomerase
VLRRILPLILVPLVLLAGCGDDGQGVSVDRTPTTADTSAAAGGSSTTLDPASAAALKDIEDRGKPTVTVPDSPATALQVTDDVVGNGAEVTPGSSVTVHYVGVGQQSGKEFDSSWSRGQTVSFPLNGVIKGWTDGLVGMKVGGRRTLVIPGDQAYGANPPSADIQPNETLVFVIDLVSVS